MENPNRSLRDKYRKHQYSGPKKCRKRVYAQMKRYHGEVLSRKDVWRKKAKINNATPETHQNPDTPGLSVTAPLVNITKTYVQNKEKSACKDANIRPAEEPTPTPKSLEINWPLIDPTVNSHELTIEYVMQSDNLSGLSGNRIVDLQHVLQWAFKLERHRSNCKGSNITFVEEFRNGFNSLFSFKCTMCEKEFRYCNEKTEKFNQAFVWGAITAGSYYAQASHITNIMDIPTISPITFRRTEKILGDVWKDHLTAEIQQYGEQEKAIAVEKNNVNANGIPHITVYVDGGWPKRSYGHDYSSPSGMACIIGKETKKCLYIGIKNKYCYHCHIYEKDLKPVPAHTCFKNYDGPSTGMEAAILVEGFQRSEEMHGIQYLNFIGDGDSSVFAQLREKVSYGREIKKTECKNHVIKNYTSALYKILANTKLPLIGRKILKPKLTKLTTVARKIIIEGDKKALREDLKNGPSHVFGSHINCKPYYCRFIQNKEEDTDCLQELKNKAPAVWALICAATEAVMSKCHRLSNDTTNVAENLMSVISKFVCGKRINLYKGGSYQRRVYLAGLSHSAGPKWHNKAWKQHTKASPGVTFKKYIERMQNSRDKRKQQPRRRLFVQKEKAKPDMHYGPKAQDVIEPINQEELKQQCITKLNDFYQSKEDIKRIEEVTIGQHDNELYTMYRCDRLTASQFGMICKRRKTTPCHNHVKSVLYKNSVLTKDMAYGQHHESIARTLFMEKFKKSVRPAGLYIDEEFGFLGASPDGVIEEEQAIVEIKCFPSLARNNQSLLAAARERKNFPLIVDGNEILHLDKKHSYYYQIQGQLQISKMNKCYFIAFISPTEPIAVLEIERDEAFIKEIMPKLVNFFKNCILPEIILRRVSQKQACVDITLFE